MVDRFIDIEGASLHYTIVGNGSKSLLLFHGFGQDHHVFIPVANALSETHTVYIFDLYFHGKSTWTSRHALEKSDWQKILERFLTTENIHDFVVGGFSLGGKFALTTLEVFPKKVKGLILIAPDGIKTSFWYSIATYPLGIRYFFKSMIAKPERFFALVALFKNLGVIDKGLLRFVESQMSTEEKRRRVYYSWVYFRHLKFDLTKIAELVNQHHIPLTMVMGKYDKVIVTQKMDRFLKKIKNPRIEILEAGHNGLLHAEPLATIILQQV